MDIIICSIAIAINISVLFILQIPKLTRIIDQNGIQFNYRPYHKKNIAYSWTDIRNIELIKFDAVSEFKGWGRKISKRYGTGYLTPGFTNCKNDLGPVI